VRFEDGGPQSAIRPFTVANVVIEPRRWTTTDWIITGAAGAVVGAATGGVGAAVGAARVPAFAW
jgi:hypothetical protein